MAENRQDRDRQVTLRSPNGETVRTSDPDEIREYREQGYEQVEDNK